RARGDGRGMRGGRGGGESWGVMLPLLLLVVGCAVAGVVWWAVRLPHVVAQPVPAAAPAALAEPQVATDAAPPSPAAAAGPEASAAVPGAGPAAVLTPVPAGPAPPTPPPPPAPSPAH